MSRGATVTAGARTRDATVTSRARGATSLPACAAAPRGAALPARGAATLAAANSAAPASAALTRRTPAPMTAATVGAPGRSTATRDREHEADAEQTFWHRVQPSNARTSGQR